MKGNNLLIGTNGASLYGAKSCDINVNCDSIEYSSPSSGKWRSFIAGRKSWSVTCNYLVRDNNVPSDMVRVGQTFQLKVYPRDSVAAQQLTGDAICTEWRVTATRGSLVQGSFTFQGTGPLS